MLAVELHRGLRPSLVKGACLIPIIDWASGRVQIRIWLKWNKDATHITLVRVPEDHPVRICFGYGNSNFIKALYWPREYQPLRQWPPEYARAIAEWWDAPGWSRDEPGGLMVDEPRLFLGRKLPQSCVRWTKDARLLYGKPPPRTAHPRIE